MFFQMNLELQEISDVTKTAWKRVPNSWGSKMKWAFTGWLKVNPGNFEQFFRRWAKNTRWLINVQKRGQIWRKSTLEMSKTASLDWIRNSKASQWSSVRLGVCSCFLFLAMRRAEQFWTLWRRFIWSEVIPVNVKLQKSRREVTTELIRQAVAFSVK